VVLNQSLDSKGWGGVDIEPVSPTIDAELSGVDLREDLADGVVADAAHRPVKGQWHFSLEDPPWTEGPGGQGRFTAYPLGDDDHGPMVVLVEYAPGVTIGVHHHESDYFSLVVSGAVTITRRSEAPGSIRLVKAGTAYGPLVVGPEGCTVLEVFADRTTFTKPRYAREVDRVRSESTVMTALVDQILQTYVRHGA
jgi:mannose-6-phosphate isomerase-like protein (cupin superfamily)